MPKFSKNKFRPIEFKKNFGFENPQFDNTFENISSQNYDINNPNYNTIYSPSCSEQRETENSDYYYNTETNNYLESKTTTL